MHIINKEKIYAAEVDAQVQNNCELIRKEKEK
jgi:hypothetical protein